jgi:Fe2+ transport system protein FeoA
MILNKEHNLGNIRIGTSVRLVSITDHKISERLLSLGFLEGALIMIKNKSPFGDAYLVEVNHRYIALRKDELALINVEIV